MDTQQPQPDISYPPTDAALDALLDEALTPGAPGIPPADPQLAQRVYQRTLPMLGYPRPVLARIGPRLWRVAAAAAIVAGGVLAVSLMQPSTTTPIDQVAVETTPTESQPTELASLEGVITPGNTRIDEQLDVLALQVDLASTDEAWGSDKLSTSDLIDQAVARFEIDQFNDDTALLLAEEPAFF